MSDTGWPFVGNAAKGLCELQGLGRAYLHVVSLNFSAGRLCAGFGLGRAPCRWSEGAGGTTAIVWSGGWPSFPCAAASLCVRDAAILVEPAAL